MKTIKKYSMEEMDYPSKISIWYNRIVLLIVIFIYAILVGIPHMIHPIETNAPDQISLNSPAAISVLRVVRGGFPFAFSVLLFTSIFSIGTIYRGIYSAFIILSIITIVRIVGYFADGVALHLIPEIVLSILCGIGLFLEVRRRKKYEQ